MVRASVRAIIHSLTLVDYLPLQTYKPYSNYCIWLENVSIEIFISLRTSQNSNCAKIRCYLKRSNACEFYHAKICETKGKLLLEFCLLYHMASRLRVYQHHVYICRLNMQITWRCLMRGDVHNNILFTHGEILKFWCENRDSNAI